MTKSTLTKLEHVPGIGKKIAQDLRAIGIKSPSDLKDQNPDELYKKLCNFKAPLPDRCVLYVLRCAMHCASHNEHNPELLKWWRWKDSKIRIENHEKRRQNQK